MKTRLIRFTAALAMALPGVLGAQVTNIDFATHGGSNYTNIVQTFGDHANLDVSNQTRAGFNNSPTVCGNTDLWNAGYSSLAAVAFACGNGYVAEFLFTPTVGNQVFLQSLQLGSYPAGFAGIGPPRNVSLRVYDTDWTNLFTYNGTITATTTVTPNVSSTTGLYLQWGTDWDVGVNNITTDVTAITATPEPASLVLFGSGIGALALVRRLRRRRND